MSSIGKSILALPLGQFMRIERVIPAGTLEARKLSSGAVMFYWRVTHKGQTARQPIGAFDPSAPPRSVKPSARGYSIEAARRSAQEFATTHAENLDDGGYAGVRKAQKAASAAAAEATKQASEYTLERLLADYCDHLETLGRKAHRDARSIFSLHVVKASPEIARLPAKEVSGEQFADMMRKLIEDGKGRTANKLRSYARAAYQTAKAAKSKPSIPLRFKEYGITHNPVADTEADETANQPDKRPLSVIEMRNYWRAIKELDGLKGAVLRLHLLTGSQRIEQLVNLRTVDIGKDAITLYDGKGRPGRPPRPHMIPLTLAAADALVTCAPTGDFALSTDGGATHIAATSLSAWATSAIDSIPGFQAKRLRSGVETLLAEAGFSQEIRGRLQSHGVSGVQSRHYDGYDYMDAKRSALETLEQVLSGAEPSKVRQVGKD